MNKRWLLLLPVLSFFLIWIISLVCCSILTTYYYDEFTNFNDTEFNFLHPWDGVPDGRVLMYSKNSAVVYFFSNTGGEKAKFVKENGRWKFKETIALWSSTGSADDYFVWPYFKHYVP